MIISQCSETVVLASRSASVTKDAGIALARSLYEKPLTIFLRGELGAGKTTFVRGLGLGLGLGSTIVSPTYALENRYKDRTGKAVLCHLDLFRLERAEAWRVASASEDFPGVRVIEWSERMFSSSERSITERVERLLDSASQSSASLEENTITVSLTELSPTERRIEITFSDLSWPDRATVERWRAEVQLPEHIAKHCDIVGAFARTCAEHLLQRGLVARPQALQRAGELHDLLRFVDFQTRLPPYLRNAYPTITEGQQAVWNKLSEHYPSPHEEACAKFLDEKGYPALATIVRPHGLRAIDDPKNLQTIEQKLLFYADKRVLFDRIVSLDERFEDFKARYGKGVESEEARRWRGKTEVLERELFEEEIP